MSKLTSAVRWSLCALLGTAALTGAGDDGTLNPHIDLFGNYELPSGKVLTGGPFEGGAVLFLEAEDMSLGGVFSPTETGAFESVFPPGMRLDAVRDEYGRVTALDWRLGADTTMRAERVFPRGGLVRERRRDDLGQSLPSRRRWPASVHRLRTRVRRPGPLRGSVGDVLPPVRRGDLRVRQARRRRVHGRLAGRQFSGTGRRRHRRSRDSRLSGRH